MIDRWLVSKSTVFVLSVIGAALLSTPPAEAQQHGSAAETEISSSMNRIAEAYVKLVLAVGQHEPSYVDAFYGPEAWRAEAKEANKSLTAIREAAVLLRAQLEELDVSKQEEMVKLRHRYLIKQLQAVVARVRMLEGWKFTFDEESKALYDAVAPVYPERHFKAILKRIDQELPAGEGSLVERLERFKRDFIVPKDRLSAVFQAAIEEARRKTKQHIKLPAQESFVVEYVTNNPWGAYNWYKGNSHSVIQVNTDLPIHISQMVDLACHEGYPGHHVYNALLEQSLVKGKGWIEFSVYALYSPQSLIAEGSANYGIEVAFPSEERIAWEHEVLFPLVGLDPDKTRTYYRVQNLLEDLSYATNEAARRYLSGEIKREEAAHWLTVFALMPLDFARKNVTFIDQNRSYVVNYNLGKDLVKKYVEKRGGTPDQPGKRWEEFAKLLASPRLPSGLK
jgi:hypothetical protein